MWNTPAGWGPDSGGAGGAPTAVSTALIIVGFLAQRLGALPRIVHERDDWTRRPVRSEEFRCLWGSPHRRAPAVPWWTTAFAHFEGWANAFMWRRVVGRMTVGLDVLHPSRVTVKLGADGEPRYTLDGDKRQTYGRDQIVHVMGLSWDGVRGVPPVRAALGAHQTASLQDRWQRNFLLCGSSPSGVMATPADLDDEAIAEFYDLWDEQHGGPEGVGGVILVQGGATYTPVTIPPAEAQLLQSRNYSREEILGLYAPGLPHHLLGWKSNTSNFGTGVEMQGIHLVQHVFTPRLASFTDALATALLPDDLAMSFDAAQWLQGDSKAQAEVLSKERQGGVLSREEWRAATGRPVASVPDDFWQPKSMTSIAADGGGVLNENPPASAGA